MPLILLFLCGCTSATRSDDSNDISRINYGAYFNFISEITPISGMWYHSFAFDIPYDAFNSTQESIILGDKTENPKRKWLDECLTYHDNHVTNNLEHNIGLSPNVNDSRTLCSKYSAIIRRQLRMVRSDHRLLIEQIRSINDLLPKDLNTGIIRNTRGLLDFVGQLQHSLFGVATDEQLAVIKTHVLELADSYQKQTAVFKKSVGELSSFSKITNDRFSNMARTIAQNSLNNMETWTHLTDDLTTRQDFLTDLTRKAVELNHAMQALTSHQQSFLTSMQLLTASKLPSYLMSSTRLANAISEITGALTDSSFQLISKDPIYYYRNALFSYGVVNRQLLINVQFPLTVFQTKFRVYEVEKIQQLVPDHPNAVMKLSNVPSGLVIQNDRSLFYELGESELIQAKENKNFEITHRVTKKLNSSFCVIALFLDDRSKIKKNCNYQIVLDALTPGLMWISGNKFLISGQKAYTVVCKGSEKRYQCETQCVINLEPGCALDTPSEFIPAIYGNGTSASKRYTISASILSHFFEDADMRLIAGDSLFDELPDIRTPKINIFQAASRDFVSEDSKMALDMQKSVQQIKNSDVIIHSMADSIILGKEEIMTSSWTTSTGYCLILALIGIVLLSVQLFYITVRVKLLGVTVVVLQNALKAEAQSLNSETTEQLKLRLGYFSTTTEKIKQIQDIHVEIVQYMSSFWFWVVIGVLGFIIVAVGTRYVFRRYFRTIREIKVCSQLALQFSGNNGKNVVICLQKIGALADDLVITSNSTISDFTIQGFFFKKLEFHWVADICDEFTGQIYEVKQVIGLKLFEAYMVQCMLATRFSVKPIFIQGGKIMKARMQQGNVTRGSTPARGKKKFQPSAPSGSMIWSVSDSNMELREMELKEAVDLV